MVAGNMPGMRDPRHPPLLDMTPEGEFRDPPRPSTLDRILARTGGIAVLVLLATGGLVLAAVAVFFAALLLPVALAAGAVAFVSLWWRARRMRRQGLDPRIFRVVVRR